MWFQLYCSDPGSSRSAGVEHVAPWAMGQLDLRTVLEALGIGTAAAVPLRNGR